MLNPEFMRRCLDLAALGRGRVGNGAIVGAVLTRGDKIIAEAFHSAYGDPHAERMLLEAFDGDILPGDVLYVNLEPCCHQGKTPPCTDIIIEKGIKTLVYGMQDPDSRVAGKGIQSLRAGGITVIGPVERALCERLNKGFIQVRTHHRPYITLKKAVTRDGRIAKDDGSPLTITSTEQNAWSHQFLRTRHDAILIGVGTVLSDDPQLNIRFVQNTKFSLQIGLNEKKSFTNNFINPFKIILDPDLNLPLDAKVVSDDQPDRTVLCVDVAGDHDAEKLQILRDRGIRIVSVDCLDGHVVWDALWDALMTPQGEFYGITSILVEGGPKTWEAFRSSGFVDEEVTLVGS